MSRCLLEDANVQAYSFHALRGAVVYPLKTACCRNFLLKTDYGNHGGSLYVV